jgi:hypothetical protein
MSPPFASRPGRLRAGKQQMRRAWLLLALLPAGCGPLGSDPLTETGTWHPTEANETNLRAMVANPADLSGGRPEGAAPGALPVGAIDRMQTDKLKPLSTMDASSGSAQGSGTANAAQ